RIIASYFKEPNVERYFVAGILHDIGRMVMVTKAPEQSERIFAAAEETNKPVSLIERELLGYDHAAVGSSLIQLWQLPKSFEEIIMYHHSPSYATLYATETAVIHIADAIVHAMELGNSGERCVPPIAEEAWQTTGLSVDLLPYIMEMVDKQFTDAVNGFIVH
ncbi:MAG: HDOD domain-containing protein, partial [Bacteroidota bacterium]